MKIKPIFLFVFIVINQGKGQGIANIIVNKPSEDDLYEYKEAYGEIENLCPDHPLNTDYYKRKQ